MSQQSEQEEVVVLAITEVRPFAMDRALGSLERAIGAGSEGEARCAGVWRSDAGALNQIISLWTGPNRGEAVRQSSTSLAQLDDVRAGGRTLELTAAPFSPLLAPRRLGSFYEFRFYDYKSSSFAGIVSRWRPALGRRLEYSPLLGVWCAEGASSDELVHAWAFEDANEWQRIRREVIAKGIWPPPPSAESSQALLRQTSVVALPVPFSPIR